MASESGASANTATSGKSVFEISGASSDGCQIMMPGANVTPAVVANAMGSLPGTSGSDGSYIVVTPQRGEPMMGSVPCSSAEDASRPPILRTGSRTRDGTPGGMPPCPPPPSPPPSVS